MLAGEIGAVVTIVEMILNYGNFVSDSKVQERPLLRLLLSAPCKAHVTLNTAYVSRFVKNVCL